MIARVHITAQADYAIRAVCELAGRLPYHATCQQLAEAQQVPAKFLEGILGHLRRTGLLESQRGSTGGYRLLRDPSEITLADIIRALEGPLAAVRGVPPEDTSYPGAAQHLTTVWIAVRAAMRDVLESTTIADVLAGALPKHVHHLTEQPDSWARR